MPPRLAIFSMLERKKPSYCFETLEKLNLFFTHYHCTNTHTTEKYFLSFYFFSKQKENYNAFCLDAISLVYLVVFFCAVFWYRIKIWESTKHHRFLSFYVEKWFLSRKLILNGVQLHKRPLEITSLVLWPRKNLRQMLSLIVAYLPMHETC